MESEVKEMDLKNKTRNELLEVAKELGITRRSKKNKKKLISSIIEARQDGVIFATKQKLVEEARSIGMKNVTSLCKEELKKVIENEKKVIENEKKVEVDPKSNAMIHCIHNHDYHLIFVRSVVAR